MSVIRVNRNAYLVEDELTNKKASRQVAVDTSRKRKGPAEFFQDNLNTANRPFRGNDVG